MGTVETLQRCEIFLGLDNDDLQKITGLCSCREIICRPPELIFRSGDPADNLYVLEEGMVDLVVRVPPEAAEPSEETVVCTIGKGGIFGWPSIVPPHVFSLTARVREPARVVVINGTEVRELFKQYPHIGYEVIQGLLRVIASRFRTIEQLLVTGKKSTLFRVPEWTGR